MFIWHRGRLQEIGYIGRAECGRSHLFKGECRIKDFKLSMRESKKQSRSRWKCFFVVVPENEVKFLAAEQLCIDRGATPANIYDRHQFGKIINYLHELRQTFYHVYLGMKFNPENDELAFYDGSPGSSL
ncbi:uncharacterized protein LOC120344494 [Styela clava]